MQPVILIVSSSDEEGTRIRRELDRYAREYAVESVVGPHAAHRRMDELPAAAQGVALLVFDIEAGPIEGAGSLIELRSRARKARCVLLLDWGLHADQMPTVMRAAARGVVDTVLTKPTGPRDEEFHVAIAEDLGEWAWTTSPVVETVRIVVAADGRGREIGEVLERLGVPCGRHRADSRTGRRIVEAAGADRELPLVEIMGSTILSNPTNREVAEAFGVTVDVSTEVFDLAVVGAGPAGLGAAVYGASEGLSTVVLEGDAFGGQAGTSSMIRNYLGFPRGVTGRQLGRRAVVQASALGARFDLARAAIALQPSSPHRIALDDGAVVRARAVLLACGVTYRRLGVAALEDLVGSGVYYGAATSQARAMEGAHVVVVGAGNSGGQAALHLARYAEAVTIVGRGPRLSTTMSTYLVNEIDTNPRISVRTDTEIVDGGGAGQLEWLDVVERGSGRRARLVASGLFVLIGATTRTDWLPPALERDDRGFVRTGADVDRTVWSLPRAPFALETSVPGVFAAGDVRANGVKRVAAAVGEGAVCVPMVHEYLDRLHDPG